MLPHDTVADTDDLVEADEWVNPVFPPPQVVTVWVPEEPPDQMRPAFVRSRNPENELADNVTTDPFKTKVTPLADELLVPCCGAPHDGAPVG